MNSGTEARIELQRLVGKFSLFFTFLYFLMILTSVVTALDGDSVPAVTLGGTVLAGVAFVPATADAIRLHRTSDPQRLSALWRRCGLLTLAGIAIMIATAVMVGVVYE